MKIAEKTEEKTETGICRWCTKEGVVSYAPIGQNFRDPKMNEYAEEINIRMMNNKLIKIAEGIFACKKCVEVYDLKPLTE